MKHHRLSRIAPLVLTIAAVAAQTAMASQDLRSPDTRDAAQGRGTLSSQDLRSPDTRDAAQGRGTFNAPEVTIVKVAEPAPAAGRLDWGDVGIGAGAMLGLMLVALGGTLGVTHRRQGVRRRQPTATIA